MARSWTEVPADGFIDREQERLRLHKFGLHEEDDYHVVHQRALDAADRAYDHGGEPRKLLARRQEREAKRALYPDRPSDSQVTPLGRVA